MIYLAQVAGSGTKADPFRPSGVEPGMDWSMIDLRIDPTLVTGYCLVDMPADPSGLFETVGAVKEDTISLQLRTRIQNRLGVTISATNVSELFAALLFYDLGKWKPCAPAVYRKVKEAYLGGKLIASIPFDPGNPPFNDPTDDFGRANETPIAAPWVQCSGATYNCNLSSNAVVGATAYGSHQILYSGAAATGDQYSQVRAKTVGFEADWGPSVRTSSSALTAYIVTPWPNDGSTQYQIFKHVAGAYSGLLTGTMTVAVNDIIKAQVSGSSISGYKNGSLALGPTTDTSITTGQPGIWIWVDDCALDAWSGGDIGGKGFPFQRNPMAAHVVR